MQRIRVFPIQLVESLWLFLLAIGAIVIIVGDGLPGENVSWYIVGYGVGRLIFEFFRGNLGRVYWLGFSEAQWTSLFLTLLVVGAEIIGILNFHWWHIGILLLMASVVFVLLLITHFQKLPKQKLLHPDHIMEVLQTVDWIAYQFDSFPNTRNQNTNPKSIFTGETSLGIIISLNVVSYEAERRYKYSLSHIDGILRKKSAKALSKLICRLRHSSDVYKIIEENPGMFHLLVSTHV